MALNANELKGSIIQKVKNRLSGDALLAFNNNLQAFEPMIQAISEAVVEHIVSSLNVIVTDIPPGAVLVSTAGTPAAQTGANTNPITIITRVI